MSIPPDTVDTLIVDGIVATLQSGPAGSAPYGLLSDAVIGITDERISYVGPEADVDAKQRWSVGGRLVTPALIDCHTHLVFGGERITEFERRLGGATYEEIASAGGGILSTVAATRAASDDELFDSGARHIRWLLQSGVGTVEIKSGYGLDAHHELRMLRVARRLGNAYPVRIVTSLLAAHAIPPEHRADPDRYISSICNDMIPAAAEEGLADAVDAFSERIAFTPAQVRRVFDAARDANLAVRLHADQLSDSGGAALAAEYGALSADHLEHASDAGVEALATAGTVAVLIPGASSFLNEEARPPIAKMRRAGVRIAVSTDLNPGTAPFGSLQGTMALASARFRLTPEETLAGTTRHAAAALGLRDTGTLEPGMRADLAVWDVKSPAALSYWSGAPLCTEVWIDGVIRYERGEGFTPEELRIDS